MNIIRNIRNTVVAAAPFLVGLMLGFLILPADGRALERVDYAGISQMGDPECARLARQAGLAFVSTAFKVYDVRAGKSRYCDLSASLAPPAFVESEARPAAGSLMLVAMGGVGSLGVGPGASRCRAPPSVDADRWTAPKGPGPSSRRNSVKSRLISSAGGTRGSGRRAGKGAGPGENCRGPACCGYAVAP